MFPAGWRVQLQILDVYWNKKNIYQSTESHRPVNFICKKAVLFLYKEKISTASTEVKEDFIYSG